jgi:hypothetical protein
VGDVSHSKILVIFQATVETQPTIHKNKMTITEDMKYKIKYKNSTTNLIIKYANQ